MKKTILTVAIFYLFAIPAVSGASYLIRLKNGGELATPMYWVEGKQIKFYYGSGIVGIERVVVDRIEMSDKKPAYYMDTVSENRVNNELPPLSVKTEKSPAPGKPLEVKAGEKDSPESLGNDLPKKQIQEELGKIQAESTEVWDEYRKMSEQEHVSKAERDKARQRVFEIGAKKQDLIRKLHEKNQK